MRIKLMMGWAGFGIAKESVTIEDDSSLMTIHLSMEEAHKLRAQLNKKLRDKK